MHLRRDSWGLHHCSPQSSSTTYTSIAARTGQVYITKCVLQFCSFLQRSGQRRRRSFCIRWLLSADVIKLCEYWSGFHNRGKMIMQVAVSLATFNWYWGEQYLLGRQSAHEQIRKRHRRAMRTLWWEQGRRKSEPQSLEIHVHLTSWQLVAFMRIMIYFSLATTTTILTSNPKQRVIDNNQEAQDMTR